MFDKVTTLQFFILASCLSLSFGSDVVADPGEADVALHCSFDNHEWLRNNQTITKDTQGYKLDQINKTLIVQKADSAYMGIYICRQNNSNTIETVTLYVRPFVKQFDKTKNMIQDDPLQLECKGYGFPTPVVQWYFGEKSLVADNDRITVKDIPAQGDSSVMINGSVRIERMTFDDAGDYRCVATNDYGINNATLSVRVKDKLAALWPFLGICAEVAILCTIIFIYEKRRAKRMEEEENKATMEEAERLNANNETKVTDDVRQRK